MSRRTVTIALVVFVAALALAATGCRRVRLDTGPGKVTNESTSVALNGATAIEAQVQVAAVDLALSGEASATEALSGDFVYAPTTLKPELTHLVEGGVLKYKVAEPESKEIIEAIMDAKSGLGTENLSDLLAEEPYRTRHQRTRYQWDLVLAGGVPTDLSLEVGAGRADIDLRAVDVRELDVELGVGECTLDLSGPRPNGLSGRVATGVGSLTIRLPEDVGVKVTGLHGGMGSTTAAGFSEQGNAWVNDAYTGTGPSVEIDVSRGVGAVDLVLVD